MNTGRYKANLYLQNGYRLIHVTAETKPGMLPNGSPFTRRFITFTVGRPRDVEAYAPPAENQAEPETTTTTPHTPEPVALVP